jgi:Family of unknown function (DUF5317)
MSPIPVLIIVAVVLGLLFGGSFRNFEHLRVNWWVLAFVGIVLQIAPVPEIDGVAPDVVGFVMLIGSYVSLLAFLAVNRWIPGATLMAIGLLMNLAVVGLNQGMPVRAQAIERAGGSVEALEDGESPKHHLMTDDDRLWYLGDVIPIPPPAGIVLSPGDLLLYGGVMWFVIRVMRGRSRENPRPLAMWFLKYRGKHAPNHWRTPAGYRHRHHEEAGSWET